MICIDANVASLTIMPGPYSEQASALLDACDAADHPIIAPPFLPIEVTNFIRQLMRRTNLSIREGQDLLARFLAVKIPLVAPDGLYAEALAIAHRYALPAVYDAHYLAVAELYQCPLWTDDRRLLRSLGARMPTVHWIGDYAGDPTP